MSFTRKRSVSQLYGLPSSCVMAAEDSNPKSGKWSAEEEILANKLIVQFEAGILDDCAEGCTLRSYLAKRLNCAPMRISKKFAGQCIGKHTFNKKGRCCSPANDRHSCSNSSTLSASPVLLDRPDHASSELIPIMSFDTFTDYQRQREDHVARIPFAVPVPEKPSCINTFWERHTRHNENHPKQTNIVSAGRPCQVSNSAQTVNFPVGLDLDTMFAGANVVPQHDNFAPAQARVPMWVPPTPGPETAKHGMRDWGIRCAVSTYPPCYLAHSPVNVVPSGASVVTPCAHGSTPFLPPPPAPAVPAPAAAPAAVAPDSEAAEWCEVLSFFCGPQLFRAGNECRP